jgi:1-acyl-sn-glycerol-3-phosphate acyltransferase
MHGTVQHSADRSHVAPRPAEAAAWLPAGAEDAFASLRPGRPLTLRETLGSPLPHLAGEPLTRFLVRTLSLVSRHWVLEVRGAERIAADADPFIFALNHSQRPVAVVVPALLVLLRQGRRIRFLADWNFMLVPGLGLILRRAGCLPLVHKDARPRLLNALRPRYRLPRSALAEARRLLAAGESVGIFPEGTVNRDPARLLPGKLGAARLSLETGRPLIPAGLRFPRRRSGGPIGDLEPLSIAIGEPLRPPSPAGRRPSSAEVKAWHRTLMAELSRMSGKTWAAGDEEGV